MKRIPQKPTGHLRVSQFSPEQSIAFLAREVTRLYSRQLQDAIAPHGILIGQYHFLRMLWERDSVTQRDLATAVGMKESTTFTALAGMEKIGLVTRARDSQDRRKMVVKLTDKGRRLEEVLIPVAKQVNDRPLNGMSKDELICLRAGLEKIKVGLLEDAYKND